MKRIVKQEGREVVKYGDTVVDRQGKRWELVRARVTARARHLKVVVRPLEPEGSIVLHENYGSEFGLTWEE